MDDESSALVSEKSSQDESRNGATLAYPVQLATDVFHTRDDSSMNAKSCMRYALALVTLGYAWFWLYDALYSSVPNSSYGRHPKAEYPDLYEASIEKLQIGLSRGLFTSVELTKAYIARINEVDSELHAVIEVSPTALEHAAKLDEERAIVGLRGPLHGIPILLKDNIATRISDGMNTTAGSYALLGSHPPRDAHTAHLLRNAGAILLGKTNADEWSHARGVLPTGWSARGGQTTSPYLKNGAPSGSSCGSAVAAAIGLAAATLGTETDGSIISPSAVNNLVGIKPTVGLTSRSGVVPITHHQDTVGPMARSIADAALLLSIIAGVDVRDNYTLAQPSPVPDYTLALREDALHDIRLGTLRRLLPNDTEEVAAFNRTLDVLRELGAEIVDPADLPSTDELFATECEHWRGSTDFKYDMSRYISELNYVPTNVTGLEDIIAFNEAHADLELPEPYYTSQSTLYDAVNMTMNDVYHAAHAECVEIGATRGIDAALSEYRLDALISSSNGELLPDLLPPKPGQPPIPGWITKPSAIAGYPIVTVPMGFQPDYVEQTPSEPVSTNGPGMPFGLAFVGSAWSEFELIGYAYAFEQRSKARLRRKAYAEAIPRTQLVDVIGG